MRSKWHAWRLAMKWLTSQMSASGSPVPGTVCCVDAPQRCASGVSPRATTEAVCGIAHHQTHLVVGRAVLGRQRCHRLPAGRLLLPDLLPPRLVAHGVRHPLRRSWVSDLWPVIVAHTSVDVVHLRMYVRGEARGGRVRQVYAPVQAYRHAQAAQFLRVQGCTPHHMNKQQREFRTRGVSLAARSV